MFAHSGVLGGVEALFAPLTPFTLAAAPKDSNFVRRSMASESAFARASFATAISFRASAISVNNRLRSSAVSAFGLSARRSARRSAISAAWRFSMSYISLFKRSFSSCSVEVAATEDDGVGVSHVLSNSFLDMNVDIKSSNFFDNASAWAVTFSSSSSASSARFCSTSNSSFCCVTASRSKCLSRR